MPRARGAVILCDSWLGLPTRYRSVATALLACRLIGGSKVEAAIEAKENIASRKNVLVLLPDNLGFEGQMELVQTLRRELDVPDQVDLYIEALDLMRLKNSEIDKKFSELYRTKYEHVKMDVVVAGQGPVLEFLLNHREQLFPGVPIVFGSIPNDLTTPTQKHPELPG